MTLERKTTSKPSEHLTGNIEYFTLFTTVDITSTGNYEDKSQRIFDNIISLISMRAQPIVVASPYSVTAIENEGAPSLTGTGYVFKFIVEHTGIFASVDENYQIDDPLYYLKYMFDGITIEEEVFESMGGSLNIEFIYNDNL